MTRSLTRAVVGLQIVGTIAIVGLALHLVLPDSGRVSWVFDHLVYYGIELIAVALVVTRAVTGRNRLAWAAISIAICAYVAGEFLWLGLYSGMESPPYPSWPDILYLGFFPPVYVGIALLFRARVRGIGMGLWIDGAALALAAGSLASAVLVEAVLDTTEGATSTVVTNLAYPLGDVFLLALIIGAFSLTGWRPGWAWLLVAAALGVFAFGDSIYLFQTAQGTYVEGTLLDLTWPVALFLLAAAGWHDRNALRPIEGTGRALLAAPTICAAVAIGVLTVDHFRQFNIFAVLLAVLALAGVVARLGLTFRENRMLLTEALHDSVTDPVTDLGNRRRLMADLELVADEATLEHPWVLVIFDLDGFKGYNDAFGHPAGDQLLARLGAKLAAVGGEEVRGYRLGGDEFCVLRALEGVDFESFLHESALALTEHGVGFEVGCSFGVVHLPDEAVDPVSALRLADERLYAQKHAKSSQRDRPHELLLQVLLEREPSLHVHTVGVATLAREVGLALGMGGRELDDLHRAGQLHDIGKLAVPDVILHKPGSLDSDEWAFLRQHTLVGERILAVSPLLRRIGEIVRSTHERWDGAGYPDGLAGENIPLAARIICACDAFDAMTRERSYKAAMSTESALAELVRCAGSQFDPSVVTALRQCVVAVGQPA
jgi:two-component system, cell cycle response regulator